MAQSLFLELLLPGLTTGCVYALVALGFVLTANVAGVVNFAQGEYVMIGGMFTAWLYGEGTPLWLAIPLVTLVCAAIGIAQERLTLAPVRHTPQFIRVTITLGVAVVLRGIALIAFGKDPLSLPGFSGDGAFQIGGAIMPVQTLWVWGATVVLLAATFWFLKFTDVGRAVRACSINLEAARLMGINTERLTLLVFAVAGGAGGLAGDRGDAGCAGDLGCGHLLWAQGLHRRDTRRLALANHRSRRRPRYWRYRVAVGGLHFVRSQGRNRVWRTHCLFAGAWWGIRFRSRRVNRRIA